MISTKAPYTHSTYNYYFFTNYRYCTLISLVLFLLCLNGCSAEKRCVGGIYPDNYQQLNYISSYQDDNDYTYKNESYDDYYENKFLLTQNTPLSTFSIDVDTASYSNIRRIINQGELPPPEAVRLEELINYFPYAYQPPSSEDSDPFATKIDIADCPWNEKHRLARIGIKARETESNGRQSANLIFLIDVSGSMSKKDKLPLLKDAMRLMINSLNPDDTVGIVAYSSQSTIKLKPTPCRHKQEILYAIDRLQTGGKTNGSDGLNTAYELARNHYLVNGTNRIILATDGDFNTGITYLYGLENIVEKQARSGISLSVLGFGTGNYKDSTLEMLADSGNGNYAYLDTKEECYKVLMDQLQGTLTTVAQDVKIQIEFNPVKVAAYRLLGYENRLLNARDFNNDTVDAGEVGAGHAVTALYEIVPAGIESNIIRPEIDPLKYQTADNHNKNEHKPQIVTTQHAIASGEMFNLKIRYKIPNDFASKLIEIPVQDNGKSLSETDDDFRFAAAVAAWGMILKNSTYRKMTPHDVIQLAREARGTDTGGYRKEFIELVEKTQKYKDNNLYGKMNANQY